jgi:vacuolar-type H+-ATPase subunit I/STV1
MSFLHVTVFPPYGPNPEVRAHSGNCIKPACTLSKILSSGKPSPALIHAVPPITIMPTAAEIKQQIEALRVAMEAAEEEERRAEEERKRVEEERRKAEEERKRVEEEEKRVAEERRKAEEAERLRVSEEEAERLRVELREMEERAQPLTDADQMVLAAELAAAIERTGEGSARGTAGGFPVCWPCRRAGTKCLPG